MTYAAVLGVVLALGGVRLVFFAPVSDDLVGRTAREARAGARLVSWPEASAQVMHRDTEALLTRVGTVADTDFARLSNVICYDADFSASMRRAGRDRVDIMVVPSHDWPGFDRVHAEKAVFRSVENGYSMVRQSADGLATTYDYQGRTLARTNAFTTDQQTMVAYVPTEGVRTPYSLVGDLFAWLCIAATLAFVTIRCTPPMRYRGRRTLFPGADRRGRKVFS